MAKSKSRRARRQQQQQQEKPRQAPPAAAAPPAQPTAEPAQPASPTRAGDMNRAFGRRTIDFGQEYYYVYTEFRMLLVVAVVMFLVMIGLAFLL